MKIGVINFSGNTGKSTLATHLLKPRIEGASSFAIESLNSGADRQAILYRGTQYDALQEEVLLSESAVVDIGSSNVDDFLRLMAKSQGSHEDFDYFVIPTMKEIKKQVDSVATMKSLRALGVETERIRIVFNAVEPADLDVLDEVFPHVFEASENRHCVFNYPCAVYQNEVFERLKSDGRTVSEVVADTTDYRAILRKTTDRAEREGLVDRIVTQRLARSAHENLNAVFAALFT